MEICHIFQILVNIAFLAKHCNRGIYKNDCDSLSFSVYAAMAEPNMSDLTVCTSFMDNVKNQFSIYKLKDIIGDSSSIFSEADYDSSSHVAIFIPTSHSEFFQVAQKLASSTPAGHRRWHPLQIIYWPDAVNSNYSKEKSRCPFQSRRNLFQALANQHIAWLSQIMISDEILFVVDIKCDDMNLAAKDDHDRTIWSAWEIYSYNHMHSGLQDKMRNEWSQWNMTSLIGMDELVTLNMTDRGNLFISDKILPKLRRRSNFNQATIKATAPVVPGLNLETDWVKDTTTGKIRFTGGMAVNILKDFQEIMNFSLEIYSGDFFVTNSLPNGSEATGQYKPVTADLLKLRQVELMIGHTTPMPSRLRAVDILMPSSYNRLFAYVHQPVPSTAREIFADPLQPKLWLAFGVTWIVLLICIKISVQIYRMANANSEDFFEEEFSSDPYFWTFATISIHGWNIHPKRRSLRIIFYLGTFITAICYNAFSAQLMSNLSIPIVPIPDLLSLFRSNIPIYATLESSNIAEVIKGLQSEGKIQSTPSPFLPGLVGARKVFQSPMAFIAYDHIFHMTRAVHNISDVEFCSSLSSFSVVTLPTAVVTSMTMPKNSPLRETFNHKILFLKERGLLFRHQHIFHRDGGAQCLPRDQGPSETPLTIYDLATASIIFLVGALLCLVILVAEVVYYVVLRKSPNNSDFLSKDSTGKQKSSELIRSQQSFHFQP